jgi:hypothetical protein
MSNRYGTDSLMLYQQQKSHYEHLFKPRSTIRNELPPRKIHSLYHNNKSAHERDRLRKLENKKMLVSLLDIYNNKPGILAKQYDTGESKPDQRKKSFTSSYKK